MPASRSSGRPRRQPGSRVEDVREGRDGGGQRPDRRLLDAPRAPCVLKTDGLAAGKGVVLCRSNDELAAGLEVVQTLGGEVLVEELLEGAEVSVLAVCDGSDAIALAPARDYKRAYDGDEGPNTGGMGSFAPVPDMDDEALDRSLETCVRPALAELARRGTPFVGTLFAGLMLTSDGPRVLEYNCRFGDPETQSVLPLVDGDLLAALAAAAAGSFHGVELGRAAGAVVSVVVAAGDYPSGGDRGTPIEGIPDAEAAGAMVFHAGTALQDGRLVTNGGRLLAVTAAGATLAHRPHSRIRRRGPCPDPRHTPPRGHRARRRPRLRRMNPATSALPSGPPQPTTHFLFYRPRRQRSVS